MTVEKSDCFVSKRNTVEVSVTNKIDSGSLRFMTTTGEPGLTIMHICGAGSASSYVFELGLTGAKELLWHLNLMLPPKIPDGCAGRSEVVERLEGVIEKLTQVI